MEKHEIILNCYKYINFSWLFLRGIANWPHCFRRCITGGVANRNDEVKGKEREHIDVRDPDIPCRVDTARGRHVTPNIGRKPKLITMASILLEMPFYPDLTPPPPCWGRASGLSAAGSLRPRRLGQKGEGPARRALADV